MVFGTCATRRPPPAASASRDAENAVSSPPIVTSAPIPSFRSDSRQACSLQSGSAASSSRTVGLAREVRRIDPPWTWILDTSVMDSGRASSIRPSIRCWKPSMIPSTSHPEFTASIVAAEMTEFIPGAGPPPHKIPIFTTPSSQQPGAPDKRSARDPEPCPTTNPAGTTRHGARGVHLLIIRERSTCDNVRPPQAAMATAGRRIKADRQELLIRQSKW